MTQHSNVPIFILAGGYGTRLSEETHLTPKPMLEIGGFPILVHIMRSYYACGFDDFVICAGYRAIEIKKYFMSYEYHLNDLEVDHRGAEPQPHRLLGSSGQGERWRVRVLDTGLDTQTGGRVARAFDRIQELSPFEEFGLTYGDGLCNVDLGAELAFHRKAGTFGTVLGVKNVARYGELDVDGETVSGFLEKPENRQGYINGGFFFFRRDFRRYLSTEEECVLEKEPLARLAGDGQLSVYKHTGFWHAMDTLRDKNTLQKLWDSGQAPWRREAPGAEVVELKAGRRGR